jgi:hypothetical protein
VLRPALFLDDGGVMNENTRRGRQWQHLVGRYFVPRLGGAPEAWAAANAEVAARLFREYEEHFGADPSASWIAYWAGYEEDWLGGMCAAVGARTVLCRPEPPTNPRHLHVRALAALPRRLDCWSRR